VLAGTVPLYAYTTNDYWLDVGRPEQYVQAHRDTLDGKMALSFPPPPAGVLTPSYVGDDTVVDADATVGPYTVLGANVRVYSGAEVRGSILWDGVHVEAGAHVVDSILASGVRIGAGARIGPGSVIGHDVSVEPGTIVAPNSRLSARETAQT
jgi:NDP-sugar pyrophosphorylase family protein